jgi:branched-chain amino acid transport system substrate-binding protein
MRGVDGTGMRRAGRSAVLPSTVLLLALLLLSTPLSGAGETLRFGCALPFSGNLEYSGNLYKKAYDLSVDQINGQGGVDVHGRSYPIEIIYCDDQSYPSKTAECYRKLVREEKVHFLLGPYSSEMVMEAAAVAEKSGIPMVQGGGASERIFRRGYRYTFGTLPRADGYFKPALEMIFGHPESQKLGLIHADDAFDRSVAEGVRRLTGKMGYSLVVDEEYEAGREDFSPLIEKVRKNAPEALLLAGHQEDALQFIRQLRESAVRIGSIYLSTGLTDQSFRRSLGDGEEIIYGVTYWDRHLVLDGRVFRNSGEFVRLYQERYQEEPDYHVAAASACVVVLKEAIETAGSFETGAVREALAGLSLETIYGKVEFGEDGQMEGGTFVLLAQEGVVYQVNRNGRSRQILPVPGGETAR